MISDTSFPALWNVFGGSINRHDYRGNFNEAQLQIEEYSRHPFRDLDGLALAKGILALLGGRVYDAKRDFELVEDTDRARAYQQLISCKPSFLRAFDRSINAPGFQSSLFDAEAPIIAPHTLTSVVETRETESVRCQMLITTLRSNTIGSNVQASSSVINLAIDQLISHDSIMDLVTEVELHDPHGAAMRLKAEVSFSQGLHRTAHEFIDYAIDSPNGDDVSKASHIMAKGDFLCSNEFSNITALNMFTSETPDSSIGKLGFHMRTQYASFEEAQRLYSQARSLFDSAGASRGTAAIDLRSACLITYRGLKAFDRHDRPMNHSDFALVRQHLHAAFYGFLDTGDYLSMYLVKTHLIIMGILEKRTANDIGAAEIGRWGRDTGSLLHAHDLGMLLLKLGQFLSLIKPENQICLHFLTAAEHLFDGLDARWSSIQARATMAGYLAKRDRLRGAQALYLSAEASLQALGEVQTLDQVLRSAAQNSLTRLRRAMIPTFHLLGDLTTVSRLETPLAADIVNEVEYALRMFYHRLEVEETLLPLRYTVMRRGAKERSDLFRLHRELDPAIWRQVGGQKLPHREMEPVQAPSTEVARGHAMAQRGLSALDSTNYVNALLASFDSVYGP